VCRRKKHLKITGGERERRDGTKGPQRVPQNCLLSKKIETQPKEVRERLLGETKLEFGGVLGPCLYILWEEDKKLLGGEVTSKNFFQRIPKTFRERVRMRSFGRTEHAGAMVTVGW